MSKVQLTGFEVSLPHAEMVALRHSGKLNLGINQEIALKLQSMGIRPKGTTSAAFHFYSWVALGAFAVGIYWAFTSAWWWSIIGLVAMVVIWKGNKSGHAENVLDAAMHDADFYERVRSLNGWIYQIDEDVAGSLKA